MQKSVVIVIILVTDVVQKSVVIVIILATDFVQKSVGIVIILVTDVVQKSVGIVIVLVTDVVQKSVGIVIILVIDVVQKSVVIVIILATDVVQKSVASMTMLSDGVLLSGGGNEIKAWDSLMRFKLIKERVVSPLRLCHRQALLTSRSAHCVSHCKGEPNPTSRSITVLTRTFGWDHKPRSPVCIR